MSGSFKTYPKPSIISNNAEFDPEREDRFGHKFKYLEQHISFKDQILEEPLVSVLEYDQINIEIVPTKGEKYSSGLKKSHSKKSKGKKKGCSCNIQ